MPRRKAGTRPGLKVIQRAGRASLYLRGTVRGVSVFESLGTDDPALAEEARATREAELYRGAIHGVRATVTFSAAAVSYLSAGDPSNTTRVNVGKLVRHFGSLIKCDAIGQSEVDEAARVICRATAKPVTIHRQVTTPLSAVLNHAARRGWCDVPKFERAKPGGKRTDWMTPAEADAMIGAAAPHLKPLLTFLFCTGARLGEVLALSWREVDLQHARATLRHTKNGDDRILDLPPRAVAALAGIPGGRDGVVFGYGNGKAYRATTEDDRLAYGAQIKRGWAGALRRGGIERHVTPHHARHSWATWHYAAYLDIMKLRSDGGWRGIDMCERYAKLAPAGTGDEALAFWGFKVAKSVPVTRRNRNVA